MNACIISEYTCTFDDFETMVQQGSEGAGTIVTDFELIKVNDHKSVLLLNCTDMEAFQACLTTPEMKQWDEENGCVDTIYSMERIN